MTNKLKLFLFSIIFFSLSCNIFAQKIINKPKTWTSKKTNLTYNIEVIDTQNYEDANLIDIESLGLKIFIDMPYTTPNNFMGKQVYTSNKCYLHKDLIEPIKSISKELENQNLYLLIYDCYRPLSVQKEMYNQVSQPGLVANPKVGSNHNRGTAIDLTLCDEFGNKIPMPTTFDSFTPQAYSNYIGDDVPKESIKNRKKLQNIMRKNGFRTIKKEWWHFNYKYAQTYPLLDIKL